MKAQECVQKLSLDRAAWPRIKLALIQKSNIKGHTPCFCPNMDHIRRCHPNAWKGIRQLKQDVKEHGVNIP